MDTCRLACIVAVYLCLTGCGSQNGLTEVGGVITYDGKPVQKGTISFLPADGNGPTAAAIVTDGRYSVRVAPGKKQVRIEGFKVLGQRRLHVEDPTSPMVDIQEQILPEHCNTKSDLTREIVSGVKDCDFALEK